MAIAILSLGSNLGNRKLNLELALQQLEMHVGKSINISSVYETESWGTNSKNLFLNIVSVFDTKLTPQQLISMIIEIETSMGRERSITNRYNDRTIDIDILFYDNLIIQSEKLTIPHPHIADRRFVLTPLCEIAPEFYHPVLKEKIISLYDKCKDPLIVRKL
jgi:2-amino-4-hydroxy-6-hydroxymethyldihydropteridine diphosphokinase